MGDSSQVDAPEGWIFLPEAVEYFMTSSSELFPLDRNPFNGSPQDPDDESSASLVRSYVRPDCERLVDHSHWGILTKTGSVETVVEWNAIRHGLFDLELGVLGRRHDFADSITSIFTSTPMEARETLLPADLERYRDCHVVLDAEAWRDVVLAWRAEENATRQRRRGGPIDFTGVSDDYLGRLIVKSFEIARRWDLAPSRDRMCEAFMKMAVAGSLRKKQFKRVWMFFGTRPENRHLRMSAPGKKASRRPKK